MDKIIGTVAESGVAVFAGIFLIGAVTSVFGPAVKDAMTELIDKIVDSATAVQTP